MESLPRQDDDHQDIISEEQTSSGTTCISLTPSQRTALREACTEFPSSETSPREVVTDSLKNGVNRYQKAATTYRLLAWLANVPDGPPFFDVEAHYLTEKDFDMSPDV